MHRKRHQQQPVYQSLAHKVQDKMVDKAVCACRKAQGRHQIRTFNCSGMLSGDYKSAINEKVQSTGIFSTETPDCKNNYLS